MKRIVCTLITLLGVSFSPSSHAAEVDLNKHWGIGLQGNTPLLGGISVRYYGLSPVYLQMVGRFIMDDLDRDHMLGGGISYAVFEHVGATATTRLYFSLEGGLRYEKERYDYYDPFIDKPAPIAKTRTYGGGVSFGGELVFSFFGIPLGLNAEIGQGLGKEKRDSRSTDTAGPFLGGGIHAYF